MKIPAYIIQDMRCIVNHAKAIEEISRRVDLWFESHGFTAEELRCGDGCSLEEIEYGNDIVDEFVAKMEKVERT